MMMAENVLRPMLFRQLGVELDDAIQSNRGVELRFNCPFCVERGEPRPDSKYRLYVHVEDDDRFGAYNCFRCGKRGRLVGKFDPNWKPRCGGVIDEEVDTSRFHVKKPSLPDPVRMVVELPKDYAPILPTMEACRYMLGRGLALEDIDYYQLGIARRRIVFPDYLDGKLVFWVSRSYVDEHGPKYFNAPGVLRSEQLYNLGRWRAEPRDQVVIVEGPISAIVAGRDAVATYGKQITHEQITLLRQMGCARYYVALDPDAKENALGLAKALYGHGEVYLVSMPNREDPASLGRERFRTHYLPAALPYDLYSKATQIQYMLGATAVASVVSTHA